MVCVKDPWILVGCSAASLSPNHPAPFHRVQGGCSDGKVEGIISQKQEGIACSIFQGLGRNGQNIRQRHAKLVSPLFIGCWEREVAPLRRSLAVLIDLAHQGADTKPPPPPRRELQRAAFQQESSELLDHVSVFDKRLTYFRCNEVLALMCSFESM